MSDTTTVTLRRVVAGIAAVGLVTVFAPEAKAACVAGDGRPGAAIAAPRSTFRVQSPASLNGSTSTAHTTIVGLWNVTFLIGDGPDVFDQGFQHWHSDNTELMVDNAVAPSLGNVCVGVWKLVGPRTYKLKHTTFNWDAQGKPAGTFVLVMTVRLDRRGNAYAGEYEADSFDLEGNVIPELHVEGRVSGVRITVH